MELIEFRFDLQCNFIHSGTTSAIRNHFRSSVEFDCNSYPFFTADFETQELRVSGKFPTPCSVHVDHSSSRSLQRGQAQGAFALPAVKKLVGSAAAAARCLFDPLIIQDECIALCLALLNKQSHNVDFISTAASDSILILAYYTGPVSSIVELSPP